jgi:hypothetical protein
MRNLQRFITKYGPNYLYQNKRVLIEQHHGNSHMRYMMYTTSNYINIKWMYGNIINYQTKYSSYTCQSINWYINTNHPICFTIAVKKPDDFNYRKNHSYICINDYSGQYTVVTTYLTIKHLLHITHKLYQSLIELSSENSFLNVLYY